MLLVVMILFDVMTIAFVHLTIQLGRERDLILHLETQIHE
jgi:hypothetical protein